MPTKSQRRRNRVRNNINPVHREEIKEIKDILNTPDVNEESSNDNKNKDKKEEYSSNIEYIDIDNISRQELRKILKRFNPDAVVFRQIHF